MTANEAAARFAALSVEAKASAVAVMEADEAKRQAEAKAAAKPKTGKARIAELEAQVEDLTARLTTAAKTVVKAEAPAIVAVFGHAGLKATTSTYGNEMRKGKIVHDGLTYNVTLSRYDASKPKPQRVR